MTLSNFYETLKSSELVHQAHQMLLQELVLDAKDCFNLIKKPNLSIAESFKLTGDGCMNVRLDLVGKKDQNTKNTIKSLIKGNHTFGLKAVDTIGNYSK